MLRLLLLKRGLRRGSGLRRRHDVSDRLETLSGELMVRIDLERLLISSRGRGEVLGSLQHHPEITAEVRIPGRYLDGRLQRALRLGMEPLLAVRHP